MHSLFLLILTGINSIKIFTGLKLIYLLIFSSFKSITIQEIDYILSSIFLVLVFIYSITSLLHFFNLLHINVYQLIIKKSINASVEFIVGFFVVSLIVILSIPAPIVSPDDPNFHKDVSLTKLLPPLSKVNYIQKKYNEVSFSELDFIRKKLFENYEEDRKIYFSKIEVKDDLVIIHRNKNVEYFNLEEIESRDNYPIFKSKYFFAGTDEFGRDLLSRIIYGIRISIFIGLFSVLISFLIGSFIGYLAGIFGGVVDALLMRIVDFFLSFPILFFVIFLIAFIGNSILLLILVFGFSGWMYVARLARNESIACMKKEFIQTLILAGQKKLKLVLKHILPNTFTPILITLIFQLSNIVIAESALSFLGLGVQPPTPTLGGIIKSGYDYLSLAWWISFESGFILIIIILAFNLLAEGIKKYFHNEL